MDEWFTVENIGEDSFAISEYKHWEEAHAYLLLGKERAVLIDSGLGVADIRRVVEKLTRLPVLVLTTHAHWDHIGGHALFEQIAVHEAEKAWLSGHFPLTPDEVRQNLLRVPCAFPTGFDPTRYTVYCGEAQLLLHDGDRLPLGGRELTVLHTPGHSPGHCCFYEAARKSLYAGDMVYRGKLDAYYPSTDPRQFWHSLQRLQRLPLEQIFPGHHQLSVPVSLLEKELAAFSDLAKKGQLFQGSGLFDFGAFQVHI